MTDVKRRLVFTLVILLVGSAKSFAADGDENPFQTKAVAASADGKTWVELGDHRWQLEGVKFTVAPGPAGQCAGVFSGRTLVLFDAAGKPLRELITLPKNYAFVGVRPEYLVAITDSPSRLEILNRKTGEEIRGAPLGEGHPLSLALHPLAPVAYVCFSKPAGVIAAAFVTVDETKAEVRRDEDFVGQSVAIDPGGRYLATAYSETFTTGAQLVHIPGAPQPMQPRIPTPGMVQPGVPRPNYPQPSLPQQSGDRWQLIRQYAGISVAFIYDLDEPTKPEGMAFLTKFTGFGRGLRFSSDGRHLSGVPANSTAVYPGFDLQSGGKTEIEYRARRNSAQPTTSTDLAHHPLLPITAVALDDQITFVDSDKGTELSAREPVVIKEFAHKAIQRIFFSPDGENLMVLAQGGAEREILARIPLQLSDTERTTMKEHAVRPALFKPDVKIPLAKLDALRGGLPKALRTSEIFKEFSDAVVVVRDSESSGTGYVIGDSGYILTCAHCVSPLRPVTVVYHPKGQPDTRETAEATVLQRDRKIDLALLQIHPKAPLHSVNLAAPIDVVNGEDVTIIANPGLGKEILDNTVTTGVVSSGKRTLEGNDYIQSSAAVNPGSSGGPMFNHNGEVIGSVDLKGRIEGVGFAVPATVITRFILSSAIKSGADGQFVRGWLDASETRELTGKFIGTKDKTLSLIKTGDTDPLSVEFAKLSPGDQKLLDLLTK